MAANPAAASEEKKHEFWATQPVVQPDEVKQLKRAAPDAVKVGAIDAPKTVADVPAEPYPIASVLEWFVLDITDEKQHEELYCLLRDNYVEDVGGSFRFEYPKKFLKWALTPPGYFKDWHVGVRRKDNKEIYGFISGVPAHIRMGADTEKTICEINFLCVSKKLRDKRMAPILIKEVTRRVNLKDIWQAVYTAGREIPTPLATTQYFHRSLNPEKLIDIKFSHMPAQYEKMNNPMEALKRSLALEPKRLSGIRPMREEDLPAVMELLKKQVKDCVLAPAYDLAELKHWMITKPEDNIVHAYVREHPQNKGVVSDFVSFYALTSSVLNHPRHTTLNAAYAYYYGCTTTDPTQLFNEALHIAQEKGFEVFNVLNMMENEKFLAPLKFHAGDGKLRYYLFNWRLKPGEAKDIGLVLM